MIELKQCPICKNEGCTEVFKAPYFRGNNKEFSIKECTSCGFWFTSPRPEEGEELNAYYETEDYVSHTDAKDSLIDKVYSIVKNRALKSKYKLVQSYLKGSKTLLDFGAGTGAFVEYMSNKGFTSIGVEPSDVARKTAKNRGVKLFDSYHNPKVISNKYGAISLWHVLEHLPNLNKDLRSLIELLEEKGVLIIAVPNHQSWDSKVYNKNWAALDIPLHLYHFNKNNIIELAANHGMSVKAIHNMPFDSFYVSMLSEKIRTGKNNHPRAFINGLISNIKGARTKNMSSLIYVLERQ